MALCPGLPGWADTRKVKPIWILLKQETVSGSGIRWAICKSAPRSRQITTPAPHHSVFYRPDALPATQPTVSKHWRKTQHTTCVAIGHIYVVHVMPLINTKVHDSVCSTNNQTSRCSLCSLNNLVLNHQLTAECHTILHEYPLLIRPVKNWVAGCWHGYLSAARSRFAYGPADATATHCLLLQ